MENGKKVCNELKAVRKQIADANGIDYTPNECTHKGDCPGTCPACESELKHIERELSLRRALGKAIVLVGLSLSVSSCAPGCMPMSGKKVKDNVTDTVSVESEGATDDVSSGCELTTSPSTSGPEDEVLMGEVEMTPTEQVEEN